jgi:signal transduction histidine kinase
MQYVVSLYRWFKDIPIARKLHFTVGTMALLIGVELFVLLFSLATLSSLRAYVAGEGLWSKAQKDAVFHLYRYGVSRTDRDYRLFEQFMLVPMGDAKARQQLLMDHPDMEAARQGFLEGRNHPADIDGMIRLFRHFNNVFYIEKAIEIWGQAQAIAMQLLPIAATLHEEINSPTPSQNKMNEAVASVNSINERLTSLEDEFSFTLGEGSRWLEGVLLRLLFVTALTVEITGLLLALSVSRGLNKGLTEIIRAADRLSKGALNARAKVFSRDEIGIVTNSFNQMADSLHMQMKELAQVNEQLRHEVGERQHAEALSQEAFLRLEHESAERQSTEEMLRQSVKLRALGQLTGGIAHDFNNLLCVIIGSMEILLDAHDYPPEHAELAHEILDSALSGTRLTRRLLAVGRKQPLQPQRVDLNALLSGYVTVLRRTLGQAIEIRLRQTPNLWLANVDPSQIEDALLNLVLNARDAMPGGGTVTIEAANFHLDAQNASWYTEMNESDYVTLTVTDTGIGMSKEVAERATEPFFTTKHSSAGSGLGLSMVYGFAKQSAGHLDIRSAIGEGTTVRLYFPRAWGGPAIPPVPARALVRDPTGTETVLLVDDNQTLLSVAGRHLTALGYKVISAARGPAALAILASDDTIDLLFTDVVMPDGMNGVELAKAALRSRPDLKVLYTSGYVGQVSESQILHLLLKPYSRHDLACAVRNCLDGLVADAGLGESTPHEFTARSRTDHNQEGIWS